MKYATVCCSISFCIPSHSVKQVFKQHYNGIINASNFFCPKRKDEQTISLMSPEQTQNNCKSIIGFTLREISGCGPKFHSFPLSSIFFAWLLLFSAHFAYGQNPLNGNQGFQILTEGNLTFTGYSHVHGALGVGGNLVLNTGATTLAEICMDGVGTYVFPGDGTTKTGLLVKGGVTWTSGGAKVMGSRYFHIGNSTGCIQSDNGVNMPTQVLPTGGTYNQVKRIEGTLDQTPSPAVFQTVGFDFTTLFNTYKSVSSSLSACSNNVQLFNASNVAISGNNVSSAQNVQVNALANGVNHLDLTQASLNNITELKFNAGALPSATKLLVISVPLTSNFVWNNANMPGLSGSLNGAYVFWNFTGSTSYNLTINTASLIIGTIFSPNHNLIKTGTGDIDGNLIAKTMTLGLGEIHYYPFTSNMPLCSEICNNGLDDDADGLVDALDTDCNTCAFVGQNLVVNGEFDNGNTGFSSDYTYTPIGNMCGNWGIYSVGRTIKQVGTPNGCNNSIWAASDRNGTGGNFMLIDPSAATGVNDRIWYQTIPVCQNTNYVFSVWTKNMYYSEAGGYSGVDPNFQFAINGSVLPNANFIMPRQTLADSSKWIKVQGTWNSGTATSAILSVVNMIPGAYGNDLAIDGLYFGLCGKTASISASGSNYCPGSPVTLTASASTTGSGWGFYEWLRNGVVVASGTTATSYVANAAGDFKLRCYTTANNTGCPQESNVLTIGSVCPENCSNSIDDDGDGLVDCADADCVVNAISNGEFDSGTTGWNLYLQSGNTGTFTVDNTSQISSANSAFINIATTTATNWHIQLVQTGKSIVAGKTYRVTFRAKANANRNMNVMLQQAVTPFANYWNQNLALTTSVQSYAFNFPVTATNAGQVGLFFNLGGSTADVWIDNVVFNEICLAEICGNGLDDDLDGLIDNLDPDCPATSCAPTVFFQETFGTGPRTSMPYTNYCYESGSGTACAFAPSTDINDGEYAIAQWPKPTSSNGDWTTNGDHTGNAQGRMMVVNADYTPGEFYRRTITGVMPNVNVRVDLWLRNTILPGYNLIKPNITFKLFNSSNVLLGSVATGDLPEDNTWHNYLLDLNPGSSTSVTIVLVNNAPGGTGNDLALDDIVAKQILTPVAPSVSAACANPNSTLTISAPIGAGLEYSINGTNYQASPIFTGVAPGTYNVTVRYANTGCASLPTSVTVSPAPTATVTGGSAICGGGSTTMTASGGSIYAWSTGATTAAITVTPATTTTYTVTVSQPYSTPFNNANFNFINATNSYGTASSLFNGVDDLNAATFHATRMTDGLTWGIAYKLGGDYLITNLGLDRRNDCCTDRAEGGVFQVYNNGVLAYQSNVLNAAGTDVLNASPAMSNIIGDEVRYVFLAGANTLAADNILNITEWNITAQSACPAIASKTVTVGAPPTAAIAGASGICLGATTTLTASGGTSYLWSTGATTAAINVTPLLTTTYTVTVTNAGGCTATAARTVTVNSAPSASISGANSACAGDVASLTASGGTSYLWSTGATTAVLSGVPPATATYTVTVTNASGCTASASQTVTVNPVPTANAGNDVTICSGASTTLNATGGTTYAWSNSLGAGATKVITPTTTTTYTVTVTNASGCTATDQVTVNVNASPTATGTANQTVCGGTQVSLSVAASGGVTPYTYLWGNGLGTGTTATVTPNATTTYSVTVTGSNGCTATAQTNVTVSAVPVANAGTDVAICTGAASTLTASGSGAPSPYTYAWSNGVTTASQSVSPVATTTYTVTVTSSNGCFATDQKIVTVQPCTEICNNGLDDDSDGLADCLDSDCGPSANAGADITICPSSPAFLSVGVTGGSAPYTYAWSNGLGAGATKTVTPVVTTTYTVTVTSASGCTSTDQVKVTILPCSENCTNGIDDDADGLVDCSDPDCSGVTAPVLADDSYTTCPGMTYSNRVTYNDVNLNNPAFSIAVMPLHGTVTIDWTGKFIYVPDGFECVTDYFTYQVCNLSSGCCEQAVVSITLGDNSLPQLTNVPADISINCDDAVPTAPTVTAFDECPGIFMDYDETSTQNYVGACGSYTITRTWTATDFCGNTVSDDQKITVLDQTKPEIFQVYTLEGGKNMIAGFAQRVTNQWKYVRFPVTFQVPPVVLASLSSNADVSATTVQVRNVGMQGFEMRLREEEAADGAHGAESVSWIAVESGKHNGSLKWEAGTLANVNNGLDTLVFGQSYAAAPLFFSSFLTNSQSDPATLRHTNLSGNGVEIFAQEETSADAEVASLNETVGYLAISTASPIVDNDGSVIGESGKLNLTNAWATVSLSRSYTKPVVIIGGLTNQDNQPVTIRTRNITANKFEVRLQEWGYLDGVHAAENVSWMVVEGSVPANRSFYCSGKGSKLKANINIFALDNCDDLVSFGYDADFDQSGDGLVSSQTWTAIDDCGNTTLLSRFDTCQVAALSVKAIFHGATVGTNSNTMRDDLRAQEWVPMFEPYSEMPGFPTVEYAIHNMEMDTASSNLDDPNVTICHKPGTAEQATLTVKQSELAAHLAHGDLVGVCGSESAGMVTICHKPGTPAQKTKVIPQSALLGHLGHGDIIGACGGNDDDDDEPSGAQSAQYRTIADGPWTSTATWESGNVPPLTNINNKTISIEHNVTILNSDLELKNNSTLWLTHGSLKMVNGNFIIGKSTVYIAESVFDGSTAGNIVLNEAQAKLFVSESAIKVGQSLNNLGGVLKMDYTCLEVSENFLNQAGKDTLINVCAIIEGNFKNNSLAFCHTQNSKLRLTNGNFENNSGAKITGNGLVLLVENGSLLNLGIWNAVVDQYCVALSVPLLTAYLPATEICTNIASNFNPCNCHSEEDNEGGIINGDGNTFTSATEDDNSMNDGNSYGGGTILPEMLEVTGAEAIVDWALVEIRNPANEAEVLGYQSVVVKKNGDIVSEDGNPLLIFPGLEEGDYYVSIRHRNHLGQMTDTPVFLSISDPIMLDFTSASLPIRGGNAAGKLVNGKRTLWGGDFNGDGKVIYQGPYNDVFHLFSKVLGAPDNDSNLANYIVLGYEMQDFNMDGKVIYQGPNNDRSALLYYSILSHTGNTSLLANYIVLDMIP